MKVQTKQNLVKHIKEQHILTLSIATARGQLKTDGNWEY